MKEKEEIKEAVEEKKKEHKKKHKLTEKDQIKELTNTLQHLQAEFENFKKRVEREKEQYCKYANGQLLLHLLPIIDVFEEALKRKENKDQFVKGIELIHQQLNKLLDEQGVRKIECEGNKFDPYYHEALMQEKTEGKKEGTILEELQPGYMLKDKVLRHAKVKVAK